MTESVTAQKVSKSFGYYGRLALAAPVKITNHGHDNLVLLSHAEYERLKRRDREVLQMSDFTSVDRDLIATSTVSSAAHEYDDEVEPKQ